MAIPAFLLLKIMWLLHPFVLLKESFLIVFFSQHFCCRRSTPGDFLGRDWWQRSLHSRAWCGPRQQGGAVISKNGWDESKTCYIWAIWVSVHHFWSHSWAIRSLRPWGVCFGGVLVEATSGMKQPPGGLLRPFHQGCADRAHSRHWAVHHVATRGVGHGMSWVKIFTPPRYTKTLPAFLGHFSEFWLNPRSQVKTTI